MTDPTRRRLLAVSLPGAALLAVTARALADTRDDAPWLMRRWYEAAIEMRRRAESWGDQAYGAVLVLDGRIVGEGPSRVALHADPAAHAEREAILDAQRRLGRTRLDGGLLVSTSRPCAACEAAAARAGVTRMVHGERLTDAGPPRP